MIDDTKIRTHVLVEELIQNSFLINGVIQMY